MKYIVLLVILILPRTASFAQAKLVPYRDTVNHFSMLIPEGWTVKESDSHEFDIYREGNGLKRSITMYISKRGSDENTRKIYRGFLLESESDNTIIRRNSFGGSSGFWYITNFGPCFPGIGKLGGIVMDKRLATVKFTGHIPEVKTSFPNLEVYLEMATSFKFD